MRIRLILLVVQRSNRALARRYFCIRWVIQSVFNWERILHALVQRLILTELALVWSVFQNLLVLALPDLNRMLRIQTHELGLQLLRLVPLLRLRVANNRFLWLILISEQFSRLDRVARDLWPILILVIRRLVLSPLQLLVQIENIGLPIAKSLLGLYAARKSR